MSLTQGVVDALKPHLGLGTRTRISRARFAARRPTAHLRTLPDLLIVGAMRSGTSSLFKYLSQHPDLAPSLRKEVEYFTRYYDRSESWYRQHFALEARKRVRRARGKRLLAFEASPYYLYEPRCPGRAQALMPDAKIVAILRDPVERAHSDYQHMCRHGFESLSFAEAVEAESGRTEAELARMLEDPSYFSKDHHHFSYVERGRYAVQIERWLAHYRRDQVLLLESEELYQRPVECLQEICDFLGVQRWVPGQFRNYSYVGKPPAMAPMDEGLRRDLRDRFAADDEALARLWRRTPSWRRA